MTSGLDNLQGHSRTRRVRIRRLRLVREAGGSQLLEFALALPFLLVFTVGIVDFGSAYNLQHKLTNAAREGARITVSNSLTSTTTSCSGPPCSIQAAVQAVQVYMNKAGLNASCIDPTSSSAWNATTLTFDTANDTGSGKCTNGTRLIINRAFTFTATGGAAVPSTQVTLQYPYTWSINHILGLLVQGSNLSLPTRLATKVVMENLTS